MHFPLILIKNFLANTQKWFGMNYFKRYICIINLFICSYANHNLFNRWITLKNFSYCTHYIDPAWRTRLNALNYKESLVDKIDYTKTLQWKLFYRYCVLYLEELFICFKKQKNRCNNDEILYDLFSVLKNKQHYLHYSRSKM